MSEDEWNRLWWDAEEQETPAELLKRPWPLQRIPNRRHLDRERVGTTSRPTRRHSFPAFPQATG